MKNFIQTIPIFSSNDLNIIKNVELLNILFVEEKSQRGLN